MKNSQKQLSFIVLSLLAASVLLLLRISTSTPVVYLENPVLICLFCILAGILGIALSMGVHILLHETGHLIFGLTQGFRFKSFRIGSVAVMKSRKGWSIARYSIPGTGGQCLMDPPAEEASVRQVQIYLLGGVAVNLLLLLLNLLLLFFASDILYVNTALASALFIGAALTAVNIYPFKGNVIPNDISNYITIERDPLSKTILLNQLNINSSVIENQHIADIDPDYFRLPADIDYSNFIHINAMLTSATYLMEKEEFEKAKNLFNKIRFKSRVLPSPIRMEVKCNVALIYLIEGKKENSYRRFESIFDNGMKAYAEKMKKYMPDKYTLLIAYYLLYRKDRKQADRLMEELKSKYGKYVGKGELTEEIEFLNKFILN